jgi:hypothetical protein
MRAPARLAAPLRSGANTRAQAAVVLTFRLYALFEHTGASLAIRTSTGSSEARGCHHRAHAYGWSTRNDRYWRRWCAAPRLTQRAFRERSPSGRMLHSGTRLHWVGRSGTEGSRLGHSFVHLNNRAAMIENVRSRLVRPLNIICGLAMTMIASGPAASQSEFPQPVPPECAALAARHGVAPIPDRRRTRYPEW